MKYLKLNYNQLSQIIVYFKSLELNPDIKFSIKRKLVHLNESFAKEYQVMIDEMNKIIKQYCKKDEDEKYLFLEGNFQVENEQLDPFTKHIQEIYYTEFELQYEEFKMSEKFFEDLKCDGSTILLIEEYFLEKKA